MCSPRKYDVMLAGRLEVRHNPVPDLRTELRWDVRVDHDECVVLAVVSDEVDSRGRRCIYTYNTSRQNTCITSLRPEKAHQTG